MSHRKNNHPPYIQYIPLPPKSKLTIHDVAIPTSRHYYVHNHSQHNTKNRRYHRCKCQIEAAITRQSVPGKGGEKITTLADHFNVILSSKNRATQCCVTIHCYAISPPSQNNSSFSPCEQQPTQTSLYRRRWRRPMILLPNARSP